MIMNGECIIDRVRPIPACNNVYMNFSSRSMYNANKIKKDKRNTESFQEILQRELDKRKKL